MLHEAQRIPLDDERVAFGVTKTVDFEVYVEVGPFDGLRAAHLHVLLWMGVSCIHGMRLYDRK